jgi:hypothetical protein
MQNINTADHKTYKKWLDTHIAIKETIDELNQYLNGYVNIEALRDALEDCQLALDGHFINKL